MTKPTLSQSSPFVYSAEQLSYVDTTDFPFVYETPEGPVFPQVFFNGSLLFFRGRLLFCCRADQQPWFEKIRLVICELDYKFLPIKDTIKFLNVGSDRGNFHVEDPRLLLIDGKVNIVYGDGYKVYHAVLRDDFSVESWNNITTFGLLGLQEHDIREKNWMPFDYNGKLAVVYSDSPRVIYFPYTGKAVISDQKVEWEYGQIRGGTPAIPWRNKLITFFHSALNDNNKHWLGGRTYFMGAYIFDPVPPFKVTGITKMPLMKGEFFPPNPIAECVKAVFPAGVADTHDSFYVSVGVNDSSTGILRVSKSLLEKTLEPLYDEG